MHLLALVLVFAFASFTAAFAAATGVEGRKVLVPVRVRHRRG